MTDPREQPTLAVENADLLLAARHPGAHRDAQAVGAPARLGELVGREFGQRAQPGWAPRGELPVEVQQRQARQAALDGHERERPAVGRRVGIAGAQPAGDADLAPAVEIPGPDVVDGRRAAQDALPGVVQAAAVGAPGERRRRRGRREGVLDEALPVRPVGVHDPDARVVAAVGAQPREAAAIRRPRRRPVEASVGRQRRRWRQPARRDRALQVPALLPQFSRPLAPEVAILLAENTPAGGLDQKGQGPPPVGPAERRDFFAAEARGKMAQEGFPEEVGDLPGRPRVRQDRHLVEGRERPLEGGHAQDHRRPGRAAAPPGGQFGLLERGQPLDQPLRLDGIREVQSPEDRAQGEREP